ncbi:MAG TPA: hypothetical protein VFV72_15230 [Candidatus Limnocylindrales bacterium]|nr:hypothetical protein [Candidatus Limnocylindrales bacterium]
MPPPYDAVLLRAIDIEGKIPRALDALGSLGGREVAVVGGGPHELAGLGDLGASVTNAPVGDASGGLATSALAPESFDLVTARWSAFRDADGAEVADADRILRPGGRLLVVHDYGRDDVSRLRGDLPEYRLWSRRDGPFLATGFRIRVIHCFWTFPDLSAAQEFLRGGFGAAGEAVAATLKRPRLSYNVGVYHRTRGGI